MTEVLSAPKNTKQAFRIRYIPVEWPDGMQYYPAKVFGEGENSIELLPRKFFVEHMGGKEYINNLVKKGRLTPYHPNGQPKEVRNGRLPNGATAYDLKEFSDIDFNNQQ